MRRRAQGRGLEAAEDGPGVRFQLNQMQRMGVLQANAVSERRLAHLWMANSRARAATVFSPPLSCSMSLRGGGVAVEVDAGWQCSGCWCWLAGAADAGW